MDILLQYKDIYLVFSSLFGIVTVIYAIYNRIKYLCLKSAATKVAQVENLKDLTGEQKFALVVEWITFDYPKIFKNALVKSIIEKLVQFAYDNSIKYAKNYIKRKTGYDINSLINTISTAEESEDIKNEEDKK